jgi:hypothetical protein
MPRLPELNQLDLDSLHDLTTPKMTRTASISRLKVADNPKRFHKIGFDLYRDNESEFVWKLEVDAESGEEFIVRTASVDSLYAKARNWSTEIDSSKSSISLIYKGHSLKAFKKAEINFDDNNIDEWRHFLIDQIANDPTFLTKVLATLSEDRRRYIFAQFPELTK